MQGREINQDKLIEEMNEGRMIGLAAPVLVPILQNSLDLELDILVREFRTGKTEFLTHVAKISYIMELMQILKNKERRGQRASEKIIGE